MALILCNDSLTQTEESPGFVAVAIVTVASRHVRQS